MRDHLAALLEAVADESSFVVFLKALSEDFALSTESEPVAPSSVHAPVAIGWENSTVDAVFEAAAAWAADTRNNRSLNPPSQTPWRRCAEILFAGKNYE